jgi:thymidylate synthase (FAD)
MKVELVAQTTGRGKYKDLKSEEIIVAIARHGTIKEDQGKLVLYLMDQKHWSPLDMINFVFEIETSRAIGREILRHKSMFFQEYSQRYTDKMKFEPLELRKQHEKNRQSSTEPFDPFIEHLGVKASEAIEIFTQALHELYKSVTDAGVAKECARFILPERTSTIITVNGTLRSWLSFLNVRCDHNAQKEIQEIAILIGESLESELPNVFARINWRSGMFM